MVNRHKDSNLKFAELQDKIMQQLIELLLQYSPLTKQQIELIGSKTEIRKLKTGDYFSEAGRTANEVGFVTQGIFRVCYYSKDGNEITRYFIDENNFLVDLNSYTYQIPSSEYIQAVTDVELVVFKRKDLTDIANTIVGWDKITNQITTKAFLDKVNRISPMLAEDATTRYKKFLDQFPKLALRIPLSYLASYLGITQQSLSRIRKNIS
ncbi:Crp/Fnr family transcriptional regulator [Chryseotalea sanaruensis]|uniref:Crp/Fnr family transcriptional regulator n=2 Tax=Chryseotalea sanaruensis TaxID=2482724 RepID=A0A401UFL2_9BACT|nr:Crp/Fnr family transcriptional regulator [Chryseotalea sanaruensis]